MCRRMGIFLNKPLLFNSVHPRRAGREAAVIFICWLCAVSLHVLQVDISDGVLPRSFAALRFIGHNGCVCPLCGGTRAFVSFSIGASAEALHYSLLGTCVSAWLLLSLPVRVIVYANRKCLWSINLYRLIKLAEHPNLLMIAMALTMYVQLGMHYFLGFYWIPLQQLTG